MNDFIFVAIVVLIVFTIIEAVDGWFAYKKRRLYQKEVVREKCRREFGILRTEFFELSRNKHIDINKPAVQFLFLHLTKLVRNPDRFKEYIESYIRILGQQVQTNAGEVMASEVRHWPQEAKDIIVKIGKIIDEELLLVFSPLYFRILVAILRFLHNIPFAKMFLDRLFEKKRIETSVREYKEVNSLLSDACYN